MKLTADRLQLAWFAMYDLENHLRDNFTEDQYPFRGRAIERLRLARAEIIDFHNRFEKELEKAEID